MGWLGANNSRSIREGVRTAREIAAHDGLLLAQFPREATAGLKFKPGVVVVFDLRAERQMQPVFDQRDFVLPERAEPLARDAGAGERPGLVELLTLSSISR